MSDDFRNVLAFISFSFPRFMVDQSYVFPPQPLGTSFVVHLKKNKKETEPIIVILILGRLNIVLEPMCN